MKTADMVKEFETELDTLEKSRTLENIKNTLIKNKIHTEESIKKLTEEQLLNLANDFCAEEYKQHQETLQQQSMISGIYHHYAPLEQTANILNNTKEYVVLEGDVIPGTDKVAKRDYLRFDLMKKIKMISQKTNTLNEVSYIYIGAMDNGLQRRLSTFAYYIEMGVFPDNNETFMSAVLEKIMENNEKTELLLTQYGEPIVMMADIDRMHPSDGNSFFLRFLPYASRRDFLAICNKVREEKAK